MMAFVRLEETLLSEIDGRRAGLVSTDAAAPAQGRSSS